jgi:hypothetical protein
MRWKGAPNDGIYFRGQKCSCLHGLMGDLGEECDLK